MVQNALISKLLSFNRGQNGHSSLNEKLPKKRGIRLRLLDSRLKNTSLFASLVGCWRDVAVAPVAILIWILFAVDPRHEPALGWRTRRKCVRLPEGQY